jgi:hypothetical protein
MVSATYGAVVDNAVVSVSRYSGAVGIGEIVSGNTNGIDGDCSDGTDGTIYSFPLSISGSGHVIYAAVSTRHYDHIPGDDYTEQAEIYQGSGGAVAGLSIIDREVLTPSTIDIDGSFSRPVDWAFVGLEILKQTSLAKNQPENRKVIDLPEVPIPTEFELQQNYPNPFNPSTTISFFVPQTLHVQLEIFDAGGHFIAKLVDGVVDAGKHTYVWSSFDDLGNVLPNGIYFYRIKSNYFNDTKKMILLR